MTPPYPVEIIGGGLAGLSLGLALCREGVPVELCEAGEYPRHRVCGEFITGLAPDTIRRLGLAPFLADALQHREVAWFSGEKLIRVQGLPAPALALSRHTLDARLAGAFVNAGGNLRTGSRLTSMDAPPGRVYANGRRRSRSRWIGLKVHVLDLPLASDLELHLGDRAYIGLTRIGQGRVNVCGLFEGRQLCAKGPDLILGYLQAAGLARLAARLSLATFDPASFCAVAALGFDLGVPPEGRLQLGDACAMIPPFTGHGMAMAFQSAGLALDPLLAYSQGAVSWQATVHSVRTRLRRQFRLRLASAHFLHPFLLQPARQPWLTALSRFHLLPLRPLYAALH
jgi:2-polyprenyl-6-methoxyphenol hydroxylase-like FAD-dependent oxidoreductase